MAESIEDKNPYKKQKEWVSVTWQEIKELKRKNERVYVKIDYLKGTGFDKTHEIICGEVFAISNRSITLEIDSNTKFVNKTFFKKYIISIQIIKKAIAQEQRIVA